MSSMFHLLSAVMVYKSLLPIYNVSVKVDAQMHSPVELNGCGGNTVPKCFLNWWVDWEKKEKKKWTKIIHDYIIQECT